MLFLYDRYGLGFMSTLHRDGERPGTGRPAATRWTGTRPGTDVYDVLHDFQVVDPGRHATSTGARARSRGSPSPGSPRESLNSTVNLGNPASYAAPGAPANGADYVGLRGGSGLYLKGKNLKSLTFSGAKTLAPEPLKWTSVTDAPTAPATRRCGRATASNLDATRGHPGDRPDRRTRR